jgi:LDH2 family malate/lactate/ureidoglycolate dehydrogenase
MTTQRRADPSKLRAFACRAFERVGVPAPDAEQTAEMLVESDLRGVDSHGVGHLSMYVRGVQQERINPKPRMRLTRGSPSAAVLDGGGGLGFVVGRRGMKEAMGIASEQGCGWVAVRNSSHFGMGACYAMMALERGMIGISTTCAGPLVAPPGGTEPLVGGNVLAIAAPGRRHGPFVLDMATCVVARGKLEIASREGKPVPEGWAIDREGKPLTDPAKYFREGGAVLPLGSTISHGAYKGFGLALAIEMLAGLLSGGGSFLPMSEGVCHAFGALRIDAFLPVERFGEMMDGMIDRIHAAPRMEGAPPIMYPGERENIVKEERLREGIPLHPDVVGELGGLAGELGLALDIW